MRRQRIPSVVLMVAAVALAVFMVWPEDNATSVEIPTLIGLQPAQVRRIVVANSAGKRAELVNQGDGEWEPEPGSPSIDSTLMFDVEADILPLGGYRQMAGLDVDDARYGLTKPEIVFTAKDVAGKSHTVEIGSETFNRGGFYARLKGGKRVVLVPRGAMDDLRSLAAGERIDTPNRVDEKLRELEKDQTDKVDRTEVSPWLEQVLETSGAVDEVEDAEERPRAEADVEEDVRDEGE